VEKQTDLNGQTVEDENSVGYEDLGLVKSCLQKTIRRGMTEASMYWALRLAEETHGLVAKDSNRKA